MLHNKRSQFNTIRVAPRPETGETIGCARVSSREQALNSNALEQQIERLKRAGASLIVCEVQKGKKDNRPGLLLPILEVKEMRKCASRTTYSNLHLKCIKSTKFSPILIFANALINQSHQLNESLQIANMQNIDTLNYFESRIEINYILIHIRSLFSSRLISNFSQLGVKTRL